MNLFHKLIGWAFRVAGQSGRAKRVQPALAIEMVRSRKAILLDVRESNEIAAGMAENAQWIATSEFQGKTEQSERKLAALPRDKVIIVYCAAGVRAGKIADILIGRGFQALNMGGYSDWVEAKLPVQLP